MCVIIVRVESVQEEYTKKINLSLRLYECNSTDFTSCYVVWRTTYWWTLCIFSDFIFLLILLFYIHRYILYECYNWTSSIRTGVVYNSDLHFIVFVSHCVMDNILMNFMYILRFFKIILLCFICKWCRLHVYYNFTDLLGLDRRSRPCDWTDNIPRNFISIFVWISIFYLCMIYITWVL